MAYTIEMGSFPTVAGSLFFFLWTYSTTVRAVLNRPFHWMNFQNASNSGLSVLLLHLLRPCGLGRGEIRPPVGGTRNESNSYPSIMLQNCGHDGGTAERSYNVLRWSWDQSRASLNPRHVDLRPVIRQNDDDGRLCFGNNLFICRCPASSSSKTAACIIIMMRRCGLATVPQQQWWWWLFLLNAVSYILIQSK